jgi:hypothetical protein
MGDDRREAFVSDILAGTNVTTTFVAISVTNEGYYPVQMSIFPVVH